MEDYVECFVDLSPKTICKANETVPTIETYPFYSFNNFQRFLFT